MGVLSAVADAVVVLFSLTIAMAAPLIGAQSVLPPHLYPAPLRDFKRWYAAEFDDYLMAQPPAFLRGIFWLEIAFLWPLSVVTIYGVLARRRWAATTSLMAGVSTLTSMVTLVRRSLPALLCSALFPWFENMCRLCFRSARCRGQLRGY
uniref:EXPERA domain-containing protein n=1 Tax=Aegilops tauschii subsp. strangulata TaxID=200361 RepID=A0A453M292_AEGTS